VDYDFNFPLFRDYQRQNTVFSHLTATADQSVGLVTVSVGIERVRSMQGKCPGRPTVRQRRDFACRLR
jgi:hypothetical protein